MTPFEFGFWIFGKTFDGNGALKMKGCHRFLGNWYILPAMFFRPVRWQ